MRLIAIIVILMVLLRKHGSGEQREEGAAAMLSLARNEGNPLVVLRETWTVGSEGEAKLDMVTFSGTPETRFRVKVDAVLCPMNMLAFAGLIAIW